MAESFWAQKVGRYWIGMYADSYCPKRRKSPERALEDAMSYGSKRKGRGGKR